MAPPLISNASLPFANFSTIFAGATGSSAKTIAVGPSKRFEIAF